MVEAMHEQHPDYFKQYRKKFRYFIFDKEPEVGCDIPPGSNYAFGIHASSSDHYCGYEKQPHYHVLMECQSEKRKGFNIPCLYSTFCLLIEDCIELKFQGDIIKRLQIARQYNASDNKTLLSHGRRKVPLVQIRRDKCIQTCDIPTATMVRFQRLLLGSSAPDIFKILDILNDGYGCINTANLNFSYDVSKTS